MLFWSKSPQLYGSGYKKKSMTGKALIEKPTVERSLGQETGSSDFPPYPTPSCQGTALSDLRSKARDP